MSISDNEDLDAKKPAAARRPTEEIPDPSHHHRQKKRGCMIGATRGSGSEDDAKASGGGERERPPERITLTAEHHVEIGYRRTMSLLTGGGRGGGGGDGDGEGRRRSRRETVARLGVGGSVSDDDYRDNDFGDDRLERDGAEVAVIPSLVSLSDDFLRPRPSPAAAASTAVGPRTGAGSDRGRDDGLPASFPELFSATSSMTVGRRRSVVLASRLALPNLRMRIADASGGGGGEPIPEDWPVGPQGAPVPSHLLLRREDDDDDDDDDAESGASDAAVAVGSALFARSRGGRPRSASSSGLEGPDDAAAAGVEGAMRSPTSLSEAVVAPGDPPLSAPPFGRRTDGTMGGAGGGATAGVRGLLAAAQRAREGGRGVGRTSRREGRVDAVRSLDRAVGRLEDESNSGAGSARGGGRGGSGGAPDLEELEADVLTRLAEILLHPPVAMVGGRYLWDDDRDLDDEDDGDDGDDENMEDAMDSTITLHPPDAHIPPSACPPCRPQHPRRSQRNHPDGVGQHCIRDVQRRYPNIQSLKLSLSALFSTIPRRVCQYPFKRNDIVWVCRTCQSDETCVLCHECFTHSNHEGHDVAFYHAQAGGCCDCGDPDAWDPKGFCPRHGRNCKGNEESVGPTGPSVLGGVRACADYLSGVVREGVEGGYRRANPKLFHDEGRAVLAGSGKAAARSDSSLPEHYEEHDGGRGRRRGRGQRRNRSLERRNTVADVEATTSNVAAYPSLPSPVESLDEDLEAVARRKVGDDIDDENEINDVHLALSTHTVPAAHHEARFDPAMASASKKFSKREPSDMSLDASDAGDDGRVFDPAAAGSSKSSPESASSSSSSESARQPAAKKARAPDDDDDDGVLPPQSKMSARAEAPRTTPARALGDLGREEGGLFLVLHCDDVHMGGAGTGHSEVIAALKELYSNPGGGGGSGGSGGNTGGAAGNTSTGTATAAMAAALGAAAGDDDRSTRRRPLAGHRPLLAPPTGGTGASRPFRAPHAEAVLDRIARLVKRRGDLVVWGTQELVAECGDVASACWRDGDPRSSTVVGGAMLDRARMLTERGLVCSIKTLKDLREEQTAAAVLKLVGWVASSCDPLCDKVSTGIAGELDELGGSEGECLRTLLRNDLKLPSRLVEAWHSLLLTLLAVPNFKAAMANAYCDTYRDVTAEYARGVGLIERSSYTLSVQFLNRVSYVTDLVRERNLLSNLSRCLLETMRSASFIPGSPGSPSPAGSSSDVLNDLEDARRWSITIDDGDAAALLALLGSFATEARGNGGREGNALAVATLDAELQDLRSRGALPGGDIAGGDSRYHGRSSLARSGVGESKSGEHQDMLERTAALVPPTLDPLHTVLAHRRYSVCISDLKCVLNVDGMARHFASFPVTDRKVPSSGTATVENREGMDYLTTLRPRDEQMDEHGRCCDCALDDWIKTLSLAQNMDGQMWRPWVKGHVETEPKGWVGAFNASISLSSLFERLLNWDDGDPSPINDPNGELRLLSCVEMTHHALTDGLHRWQRSEMLSYRPTRAPTVEPNPKLPSYALCPASLPFSTVAAGENGSGAPLAMPALPLAQIAMFSFHLPLHRFVAACIREVARRHDVPGGATSGDVGAVGGADGGGIGNLLQMLTVPKVGVKDASSLLHRNTLLFRGLMEFPTVALSRAAQIRAGIWKRNGPGMSDQVLNYSEPPFCRPLADADILLLQFALICHASSPRAAAGSGAMAIKTTEMEGRRVREIGSKDLSSTGLMFGGMGTMRLVNLLIHRFGVFDFLGFEKAPNANVDQYKCEIQMGLYPPELSATEEDTEMKVSEDDGETSPADDNLVLPWTYCPAQESATCLNLVEELLHLIIILITEMPPPSPLNKNDHAMEAKRRLKREVIHRLASGNKTHSEMAEVHHVLPQRDNLVLSESYAASSSVSSGAVGDPAAAGGEALEDALDEVAVRRHRSGAPDEWEMRREAWDAYDPAFRHIGTRAHQSAAERRPSPPPAEDGGAGAGRPYAPRPDRAHVVFSRIRRDLTSDACVLAMAYRVLHVHCHEGGDSPNEGGDPRLRGRQMYEKEIKSETALARAVHLLTLGAFAWCDDDVDPANWRDSGSVFCTRNSPPSARDWVDEALLREPSSVMRSEWYHGEENALRLLGRIASEGGRGRGFLGGLDPSLSSGAAWLCDFAARHRPEAAAAGRDGRSAWSAGASRGGVGDTGRSSSGREEMERRKNAAKERAMAAMRAQMAKFAANIGEFGDGNGDDDGDDGDDPMSEDREASAPSRGSDSGENNGTPNVSTPVRNRADSTGGIGAIRAMELSAPATPAASAASLKSPPRTPRTPGTPGGATTPRRTPSQHLGIRLLAERPQCIICGADNEHAQVDDDDDNGGGDASDQKPAKALSNAKSSTEGEASTDREKALAFCGYAQASTVATDNGGRMKTPSHVGVHVTLCGHAIHKSCCDAWQRDDRMSDRLDGGARRREFRCPLCQRLSNCLVPFVDVGADWTDPPSAGDGSATTPGSPALGAFKSEEEPMTIDGSSSEEGPTTESDGLGRRRLLHDFLRTSKWWTGRNDASAAWDGQCTFSERSVVEDRTMPASGDPSAPPPVPSSSLSPARQSLRKIQSKFGKRELVGAWNSVLRTPRLARRRVAGRSSPASRRRGGDSGGVPTSERESNGGGVTDVLRRFMDQVSDVGHRADMRRMGEEALLEDFGEFRHYLSEKVAYNRVNRAAGKEMVDWPMCLSPSSLTETRRQELSREKLVSKLLFSIQAFTYSCCCEAAEARDLLRDADQAATRSSILSKFGVGEVAFGGDLLVLPDPDPLADGGSRPFEGRLGKLRYLALALMVTTSPVAREVAQLCASFPVPEPDPFDFERDEWSSTRRAPVAYPVLCGHVLTHTAAAMIAVTGRARAEEGMHDVDSVVDDCRNFVQIGLVARVAQVLLARLKPISDDDSLVWEQQVYLIIEQNLLQTPAFLDPEEREWLNFGVATLFALVSTPSKIESKSTSFWTQPSPDDVEKISSEFLQAIESVKPKAIAFLRDLSVVAQILVPNIFCRSSAAILKCNKEGLREDVKCGINETTILKSYMSLFKMENLCTMLDSDLLQQVVQSWYTEAAGKSSSNLLDFPRTFHATTWPVSTPCIDHHNGPGRPNEMPPTCSPLLGNQSLLSKFIEGGGRSASRIFYLPKSYTDLYAELSEMCPDIEQTALCLVCGQVLNAAGKGECTKHAYKCGGGAGVYFLVQECVGLIMHGQKAAYVHSPYVDFYGETPQYRGRPLNLDPDRYRILQSLWSGHLVREKVIAERASTRQVIIPNYY